MPQEDPLDRILAGPPAGDPLDAILGPSAPAGGAIEPPEVRTVPAFPSAPPGASQSHPLNRIFDRELLAEARSRGLTGPSREDLEEARRLIGVIEGYKKATERETDLYAKADSRTRKAIEEEGKSASSRILRQGRFDAFKEAYEKVKAATGGIEPPSDPAVLAAALADLRSRGLAEEGEAIDPYAIEGRVKPGVKGAVMAPLRVLGAGERLVEAAMTGTAAGVSSLFNREVATEQAGAAGRALSDVGRYITGESEEIPWMPGSRLAEAGLAGVDLGSMPTEGGFDPGRTEALARGTAAAGVMAATMTPADLLGNAVPEAMVRGGMALMRGVRSPAAELAEELASFGRLDREIKVVDPATGARGTVKGVQRGGRKIVVEWEKAPEPVEGVERFSATPTESGVATAADAVPQAAPSPVPATEPMGVDEFLSRFEGKMQSGVKTKSGKFITGWDHGDAFNRAESLGEALPEKVGEASGWRVAGEIVTDDDLLKGGYNRDVVGMYEFLRDKGRLPKASPKAPPVPEEGIGSTVATQGTFGKGAGAEPPAPRELVDLDARPLDLDRPPPTLGERVAGAVADGASVPGRILRDFEETAAAPITKKLAEKVLEPAADAIGLARIFKSAPQKAGAATEQALWDAHVQRNVEKAEGTGFRIQLDNAMKDAKIELNGETDRKVMEWIAGAEEFPQGVPREVEEVATEAKKFISRLLDEAEELGIISEANRSEHAFGLLLRKYDNLPAPPKAPQGAQEFAVHRLFMADDAEGLLIKMPKEKVLKRLQRILPGIEESDIPYIHEVDGMTGFKIGKGDAAKQVVDDFLARLTPELEAEFAKTGKRVTEKPLGERLALGQRMSSGENVSRTIESIAARNEKGRIFRDLSESVGRTLKKGEAVPDGYAVMPKEPKYGALGGKAVPQPVADFLLKYGDTMDDGLDFLNGAINAVKEALVVTPRGTFRNFETNFLQYSTLAGVHPILDPDSLVDWAQSVADMKAFKRRGYISPSLRVAMENGVDPHGITDDLIERMDEALSVVDNFKQGRVDAFEAGRRWTQILGGSPHLEFGPGMGAVQTGALRGAVGGTQAALPEVIRAAAGAGGNIGTEAALGAAQAVGMGAISKRVREAFNSVDPIYQTTIVNNALRRTANPQEAGRLVRLFSQNFRPIDQPELMNTLTGRIRGRGGIVGQVAGKVAGPTFASFPVNHARILYNGFKERPLSAFLALAQGRMVRRAAIASVGAELGWDKAKEEWFDEKYPDAMPFLVKGENGKMQMRVTDLEPVYPGGAMFGEAFRALPQGGVPLTALTRILATMGAASQGDEGARDPSSGFPLIDKRNAQVPLASLPGAVGSSLGGAYSPLGSARPQVMRALRGETGGLGEPLTLTDALLGVVLGTRAKTFDISPEGRPGEDAAARVSAFRKTDAVKEYQKVLQSKTATEEEKERARVKMEKALEKVDAEPPKVFGGGWR